MPRRFCAAVLTIIVTGSLCTDALACGDKFLRVGRSSRFRAYASVHPSPILVYAPRWTRHGIDDFEHMLKRAGHKPLVVTTVGALSQAIAAGPYGLVIASYADTSAVKKEIAAVASRPMLLPIVYKPTKAEAAEAASNYSCLLKPETMTAFQALEQIDRVIELRLKDAETTAVSR